MDITQKYFRDRLVLLLLTVNIFLAALATILILLRVSGGHGSGYFVQYRANLGLNAYTVGSVWGILAFAVFAVAVAAFHWLISLRIYHIRRPLSVAILASATLLLVLTLIVSNALLVLR